MYNTDDFDWTEELVCELAGKMVDDQYIDGKAAVLQTFCDLADKLANNLGGGSYNSAFLKVKNMPSSNDTKFAMKALEVCETKESRLALVRDSTVNADIYSVGLVVNNGISCPAYIMRTSGEISGKNSIVYGLVGSKGCNEVSPTSYAKHTFHPKNNVSGTRFGTFIKSEYSYSGVIPTEYTYMGQAYPTF